MLLWIGFSLVPTYAEAEYAEIEMTYYVFVTHKLDGISKWQHFYSTDKLFPGIYHFQIVVEPRSFENASLNAWYALRGQFQFVDDPQGGVKIDTRHAFNERDAFIPWLKIADKWVAIKEKQLNPIMVYMKQREPLGHHEPNFMRFMVLKKNAQESWQVEDKTYRVYRLHYFNTQNTLSDEYKKVLSRFINPSEAPSTDFKQLKKWVAQQEDITLLTPYMTTPDDNYEEFYGYFQTWFNQWFLQKEMPVPESLLSYHWLWLSLATLVIVILVIIIGKIGAFYYKIFRQARYHRRKDDNMDSSLGNTLKISKPALPRPSQKMATTPSSSMLSSYMQKEETELSKKELKQFRTTISQLEQQLNVMNEKLIELENYNKTLQKTENHSEVHLASHEEISKMVWKALKDHFSVLLATIISRLLQDTEFKQAIESQIENYLHGQFNNNVNKTLELYAEQFWKEFIKENQNKKTAASTLYHTDFYTHQVRQAQLEIDGQTKDKVPPDALIK